MANLEGVLLGQRRVSEDAQAAIAVAAREYTKEVRRSYLHAIPLDEVRKLAPGVRLQPIIAYGIKSVADCQGWKAANFQRLRGIGPDSAYRIAAACEALTKFANEQPIRRPSVLDGSASAKSLYAKICIFARVQALLHGQQAPLEGAIENLRPKRVSIESRTSLVRWLFGSESAGPLREAINDAATVAEQSSPDHETGQILVDGTARLTQAKAIGNAPISHEDLLADVAKQEPYYQGALDSFLGPVPIGGNRNLLAESPPLLTANPANQPVPIQMAGSAPTKYVISGARGMGLESQEGRGFAAISEVEAAQKAGGCWVRPGREVKIGGYTISSGLIYVGRRLSAVNQRTVEPALIDPTQRIDRSVANCHVRMLDYWSNYSSASPGARASYLQWHEGGRNDPSADIGYVFLYFYGLERRALADAASDPDAQKDIPAILSETQRLRSIYSANGSFARYSADFLEYIETTITMQSGIVAAEEPPALAKNHLSFECRRGLGSFALSGKPLPAAWAYAWFHNDPRTRFPTAAERCPDQVAALFREEYGRQFGEGLVFPTNKTKLKLTYKPASASFGAPLIRATELPDVSVLSTAYAKLQSIAQDCFGRIDGYSRFIARNPGKDNFFEALLLLPASLWPESVRSSLRTLSQSAQDPGDGRVVKLKELLSLFPNATPPTKSKYSTFCRALGALGLGLEPDVRFGGALPLPDDPVAAFPAESNEATSDRYGVAALLLLLASVVASADGDFSEPEAQHLRRQIKEKMDLPDHEQRRLLARMAAYRVKAPSTSGLKQTIEGMNAATRTGVIDFLITLVCADGVVAPTEVKAMERIYSLFGMDVASLYAKLHSLTADPGGVEPTTGQKSGVIQLDKAKIERLKAVSAEVTNKLTVIFNAGEEAALEGEQGANEPVSREPAEVSSPTLLGLDTAHAELLAVLLGRPQWTRTEFEEMCSEKNLMPDGAIERINDAALAKFEQLIIEGEDPLDINAQLLLEEKAA